MVKLVEQGKVKAVGVSNFTQEQLQSILAGPTGVVPAVNQCELHPQCQWHELRAFCAANSVQFMGYSALPNHLVQTRRKVLECSVDAF